MDQRTPRTLPDATRLRAQTAVALRAAGCVFADDEARMLVAAAGTHDELTAMVERRAAGLPLEQVVGWARFCGLRIAVEPGVFVPRRRTELLVRRAVGLARRQLDRDRDTTTRTHDRETGTRDHDHAATRGHGPGEPVVVVDLCCGSGAVGAAVAAALPAVELHAVDIDPAAVRCAHRNLATAGGHVYAGDLDAPLPDTLRGRVDLLLANVPYVPTAAIATLPTEARDHEPRVALDGGADGLAVARRVAAAAPGWLAPGGALLIETSAAQAPLAAEVFAEHGLRPRVVTSEPLEATVVSGTAPGGIPTPKAD